MERGAGNCQPENFRFTEHGDSFPLLPVTEHNILRIGQEAATNAVKHARARNVEVELSYAPGEVALRVKDGRILELGPPPPEPAEEKD